MRIKFLSLLTAFLLTSIAISSCLDTDTNYEFSADATVKAFALDTIYGVDYPFTIDQVNRLIFNEDSMPISADTLIDSIKITTFTAGYAITSGVQDTVLNIDNYQDLSAAATEGLTFTVHAASGATRIYTLKINIHKQDPDSLQWTNMGDEVMDDMADFATANIRGKQRAVVFGPYLYIYVYNGMEDTYAYRTETESHNTLERITLTGLPQEADITSVCPHNGRLYMSLQSGDIYSSADGTAWQKEETLSGNVTTLIADFTGSLLAIVEHEGTNRFAQATDEGWTTGGELPEGFPTSHLYATSYTTANFIPQLMIVGHTDGTDEKIIPWAFDGRSWAKMDPNSSYDSYCTTNDVGNYPAVIHYADNFYMLGEKLQWFYKSENGLGWFRESRKFLPPAAVSMWGDYSLATDNENYVWLVTGSNDATPNQLWRGRLNKLGFARQ